MTNGPQRATAGLSKEQLDLIQQFEADYNAVDKFLRKQLHKDNKTSFSELVSEYARQNRHWRDADLLRTVADVRNAIVHSKTAPYNYLAVPAPGIARDIGACRARLLKPVLVIPGFGKVVETISSRASLADVLRLVQRRDFSQFPVYDDTTFRGLLTENGITRWLAHQVSDVLSLVELDEVLIKKVLEEEEEKRQTWDFLSRDERVDNVVASFASKPLLEAVLITEHGNSSEKLLGFATRWDILRFA